MSSLVAALTLEEKASLTAGGDLWGVPGVARLGIPALAVTDGPNGARGPTAPGPGASATTCVPCGSALGATWDPELLSEVGALLADEARAKGCRVLLAPTVNIPRSPLAGRNFECYAEDPLLSGRLAAAFVAGVQSRGVGTTVKHFVANDAETDRMTASSVVDERTLRELYLVPFELAVHEGGALGVMTGYNRVNGTWCAEHAELLAVLRREWGFTGLVMTDWYAVASTEGSSAAGVDVEMPGPPRAYGPALADAVRDGRVPEAVLDAQVSRILSVYETLGLLDPAEVTVPDRPAPEIRRGLARRAATSSFVLLRNEGLLPLGASGRTVRRVAVLGPVDGLALMGGGSAQVTPDPPTGLAEALAERLGPGTEVVHRPAVDLARSAPVLEVDLELAFHPGDDVGGEVVHRARRASAEAFYLGAPYGAVHGPYAITARGRFTPDEGGRHTFTMTEVGRARLLVGGRVVVDAWDDRPPPGRSFMGLGRAERSGEAELAAGQPVDVEVHYASDGAHGLNAFRVGCRRRPDGDQRAEALAAAADADAVVLVVGTTGEWESEGFDRESLALPAAQDELVAEVLAANPATVVVVNTGSPVSMPWAADAPAVLQAWFGGQEMGPALADVLTGAAEPGGRLAVTLPAAVEHTPAYGNFPGEGGEIRYGERLLVGYRWYEGRGIDVPFPFGHGLSYTSWHIGEPRLSASSWGPDGGDLTVTVTVTNTGDRPGSEVVQCYVEPPPGPVFRPTRELKAFAKVSLDPGRRTDVDLLLSARSFAHWDVGDAGGTELRRRLPSAALAPPAGAEAEPAGWRVLAGRYTLHLGRSSADIAWRVPVDVAAASPGPRG